MTLKLNKLLRILLLTGLFYGGSYVVLRLSRYLVHQQFMLLFHNEALREGYVDDPGPSREGLRSYELESVRNQVGCGRIQKEKYYPAEAFILGFTTPLRELEMWLRGYGSTTLYVMEITLQPDHISEDGRQNYFSRRSVAEERRINRFQQ